MAMSAQSSEHLKFMGVPITGTIAQFQTKLTQKGCTYNKSISASFPVGARAFKGTFAGNKVDIYVYYNTSTKVVYRVKAIISGNTEKMADQEYAEMLSLFKQKYDTSDFDYDKYEGKESVFIYLPNGRIDMYISKDAEMIRYPYIYNVHMDYWDGVNTNKNTDSKLDDI